MRFLVRWSDDKRSEDNARMLIAINLILVVVFLLMNAFFVVAEFALVRVRSSQIDIALDQGKRGAKNARKIADNVNAYLSACQLGITLASLALGWLGEPTVSELIHPLLGPLGIPDALISAIAIAIGFTVITALHIVVGELIPKSLAIFSTERYALFTATPLLWFYRITYPVMVLFNSITNGVVKLLGHDPANEHEVYTDEEIKLLIDESTESGLIEPEQNEFVDNIFDLGDKDAASIMTPRTELVCLDLEDPLEENIALIRRYKYSRYPICQGSKDRLIGFVHTKDLYGQPDDLPISEWNIHELPAVPETVPISKLLATLQEDRTKMAVVVDEHGGTAGIVTINDIVGQIVGRIEDEYRHPVESAVVRLEDGTFLIDGAMAINDVVELIGFEPAEASECDTAGGLLLTLFDRIPAEGDTVVVEELRAGGGGDSGDKRAPKRAKFTVVDMDRLRIDKINVALHG